MAFLVHQTGSADLERIQERYRELGLADRVAAKALIEDMAAAYTEADLKDSLYQARRA